MLSETSGTGERETVLKEETVAPRKVDSGVVVLDEGREAVMRVTGCGTRRMRARRGTERVSEDEVCG